jgi:NAD(P)-dependent dehydrogenase (short-subunit alcohol dehydrogenase family)
MASHDGKVLSGMVALVTGAGRGLGRAFAEKLAALGADVAIHGMRENGPAEYGEGTTLTAVAAEIGREFGVRSQRVLGDLTKGDDIARVIAETEAALGPIDILVHNAGGDIAAAGGKPDPNDAVNIKEADVRAVLERDEVARRRVLRRSDGRLRLRPGAEDRRRRTVLAGLKRSAKKGRNKRPFISSGMSRDHSTRASTASLRMPLLR